MRFPKILSRIEDGETLSLELEISDKLIWFRGHFPGFPVLPGIVQLRWAVELSQQHFGFGSSPHEVMRLKFKSIIVPPLVVEVTLTQQGSAAAVFAFTGQGKEYSQGKLIFREDDQ